MVAHTGVERVARNTLFGNAMSSDRSAWFRAWEHAVAGRPTYRILSG